MQVVYPSMRGMAPQPQPSFLQPPTSPFSPGSSLQQLPSTIARRSSRGPPHGPGSPVSNGGPLGHADPLGASARAVPPMTSMQRSYSPTAPHSYDHQSPRQQVQQQPEGHSISFEIEARSRDLLNRSQRTLSGSHRNLNFPQAVVALTVPAASSTASSKLETNGVDHRSLAEAARPPSGTSSAGGGNGTPSPVSTATPPPLAASVVPPNLVPLKESPKLHPVPPPLSAEVPSAIIAKLKEELQAEQAASLRKMKEDISAEAAMFREEMQCSLEELGRGLRRSIEKIEQDIIELGKAGTRNADDEEPLQSGDRARKMEAIAEKLNAYHDEAFSIASGMSRLSAETEALRNSLNQTEASVSSLQTNRQAEVENWRDEHKRLTEVLNEIVPRLETTATLSSRLDEDIKRLNEESLRASNAVERLDLENNSMQEVLQQTNAALAAVGPESWQADVDERLAAALEADHQAHSQALADGMSALQGKLDSELVTLREEATIAGGSAAQFNLESATLRHQLCELCSLLTGEAEDMSRQVVQIEATSELKHAELRREQDEKIGALDGKIEQLNCALINEEMALEEAVQHLQSQLPSHDRVGRPTNRANRAAFGTNARAATRQAALQVQQTQSQHLQQQLQTAQAGQRNTSKSLALRGAPESRLACVDNQDQAVKHAIEKLQNDTNVKLADETAKREAAEAVVMQLQAELVATRTKLEMVNQREQDLKESAQQRDQKPVVLQEERIEQVVEHRETPTSQPQAAAPAFFVMPTVVAQQPAVSRISTSPPVAVGAAPSAAPAAPPFARPGAPIQVQRSSSFSPSPASFRGQGSPVPMTSPLTTSPRQGFRPVAAPGPPPMMSSATMTSSAPLSGSRPASTLPTQEKTTTTRTTKVTRSVAFHGGGGSGSYPSSNGRELENGGLALPGPEDGAGAVALR